MTDNHVTTADLLRRFYTAARTSSKMHHDHLKLADGTTLSCQDFVGTASVVGKTMEVALFDKDGEYMEVHEWGESDGGVYRHRRYQHIVWMINRRGGLAA